jgi:hypothetical protein
MQSSMSDVEALLSVDAGRVPAGTVAFFARDPERTKRRALAVMAVLVGAGALASLFGGLSRPPIALLALATIGLFVMALPPERDPELEGHKRATLVLTPNGMIVRDGCGLRSWSYDELADVRPFLHQQRIGLLIAKRDGSRQFVDTLLFKRGEKVNELIGRHLKPREA